ncbi:MAG: HEAT repeat domain-containing protein [Phycisphaerae bacterium]|nr:HEAT repeat domain-containing protein [Phycisphaerae bacterium]
MIESAEEFRRLRESDDPDEYRRAACDSAPPAVWRDVLARFPELREWVAHNRTVPHEVLTELASDPDPRVRWMVAAKRKLAAELQLRLAVDSDEGVRQRIAWNARATRAALERLAGDSWIVVAEHARARLAAGEYV